MDIDLPNLLIMKFIIKLKKKRIFKNFINKIGKLQ